MLGQKRNKNFLDNTTIEKCTFRVSQFLLYFLLFPILSNLNQNETNSISVTKLQMKNTVITIILKNEKAHNDCPYWKEKYTFLNVQLRTFGHLLMNSAFSPLVSPLHLYIRVS